MRRLLACLAALCLSVPAAAQTAPVPQVAAEPDPAFTARANELPGLLSGSVGYDGYFSPAFKAAVPKAQFDAITAQLIAGNGPVTGVESVAADTPWTGTVMLGFRDAVATMRLAVDATAPHRVGGLRITLVSPRNASPEAAAEAIKNLRGETGFAVARLGDGPPEFLAGHQLSKPLAVGSAFKLAIFAELVRATNAGERSWDDKITLDGAPLPGGAYTFVPKGTAVPIREVAMRMISVSDNSATDILLRELGREKVEAMLPVLGVKPNPRNRPYLSTLEMFKLKGIDGGALAERYLSLDEDGQRAMLNGEVAAANIAKVDPHLFKDGKPILIDKLEWFFSPADLVHVMDWLRRNTEGPKGAEARAILSKNPGVPLDKAKWPWIGFKGGSEPGVINLTLLLKSSDGGWYAVNGTWNDTAQEVETMRFVNLVAGLTELAR